MKNRVSFIGCVSDTLFATQHIVRSQLTMNHVINLCIQASRAGSVGAGSAPCRVVSKTTGQVIRESQCPVGYQCSTVSSTSSNVHVAADLYFCEHVTDDNLVTSQSPDIAP